MATWESNPSVPHTGGTFTFPENTGTTAKVYTITYTDDDGCTAQTTYTVQTGSTCQPCPACDNWELKEWPGLAAGICLDGTGSFTFYVKLNGVEYYDLTNDNFEVELVGNNTDGFEVTSIDKIAPGSTPYILKYRTDNCCSKRGQTFSIKFKHKDENGCICDISGQIPCIFGETVDWTVTIMHDNEDWTSRLGGPNINLAYYTTNEICEKGIYTKDCALQRNTPTSTPYLVEYRDAEILGDVNQFKYYKFDSVSHKIVHKTTGDEPPSNLRPFVVYGLSNFPFSYNPNNSYVSSYDVETRKLTFVIQ